MRRSKAFTEGRSTAHVGHGGPTLLFQRAATPAEIGDLFRVAGITPDEVTTIGHKHRGRRRAMLQWFAALTLLSLSRCPRSWRRDVILAGGRKTSTHVDRRPGWLYFELGEYALESNQSKRCDRQFVEAAAQASPTTNTATARSA